MKNAVHKILFFFWCTRKKVIDYMIGNSRLSYLNVWEKGERPARTVEGEENA